MNFPDIARHITPLSILDLGCNVGGWTREARKYWPDAVYFLIEANPECAAALADTGESFRIAVLSDSEKEVEFFTRRGAPTCTGASYKREQTPFYEGENAIPTKVMTQRLDDVCEGSAYNLVKIDCQGAELDIMRGGENIISEAKAVLVEISHVLYNEGAPSESEVNQFLFNHGFRPVEVVERIHRCIPPHDHIQSTVLFLRQ